MKIKYIIKHSFREKRNLIVIGVFALILILIFSFVFSVDNKVRDLETRGEEDEKGLLNALYNFWSWFYGLFYQGIVLTDIPGNGFYGMKIESIGGNSEEVIVVTTGAEYKLTRTGLEMWRRIDSATNTINKREVSELTFSDIGELSIESYNDKTAVIQSNYAKFTFNSDSLFFIEAKQPLIYTHTNLIENAIWNKPEENELGDGLNRMWTDGYGGSLHSWIKGSPVMTEHSREHTKISMPALSIMGEMVYPSKKFDFEKLYGQDAKPFYQGVFYVGDGSWDGQITYIKNNLQYYLDNGYGVFGLFATFYGHSGTYDDAWKPILLEDGRIGYKIDSENENAVRDFISFAHNNGFKVTTYLSSPGGVSWKYPAGHPLAGQLQPIEVTLQWMREFQEEYNIDGWYFDSSEVGNLLDDYNFIRQVRTDVGSEGIIINHDSGDIWDNNNYLRQLGQQTSQFRGLKGIMIDDYVDYSLVGEVDCSLLGCSFYGLNARIHEPNDLYLRFYTSGYGMSQAFGMHKLITNGKASILEEEKYKTIALLNSADAINTQYPARSAPSVQLSSWKQYFKPVYDIKKQEYLSGNFNPDVQWPVDSNEGWFRKPKNILVEYLDLNSVKISWNTDILSNSEVSYSSNSIWKLTPESESLPDGPDGSVTDENLVTSHSITITGLDSAKNYEFRIRSDDNQLIPEKIIYGFLFGIDSDKDSLPDDWEIRYFGNLNQNKDSDFDNDKLNNLKEWQDGTNPAVLDVYCGNKVCDNGESCSSCSQDCGNCPGGGEGPGGGGTNSGITPAANKTNNTNIFDNISLPANNLSNESGEHPAPLDFSQVSSCLYIGLVIGLVIGIILIFLILIKTIRRRKFNGAGHTRG